MKSLIVLSFAHSCTQQMCAAKFCELLLTPQS